eukprot:2149281-Pleurochrysis_carterae.AAC.1
MVRSKARRAFARAASRVAHHERHVQCRSSDEAPTRRRRRGSGRKSHRQAEVGGDERCGADGGNARFYRRLRAAPSKHCACVYVCGRCCAPEG